MSVITRVRPGKIIAEIYLSYKLAILASAGVAIALLYSGVCRVYHKYAEKGPDRAMEFGSAHAKRFLSMAFRER